MSEPMEDSFPLLSYLDNLVEDLRGLVPRAVKQHDVDAVHYARVATRRLKAAMELMAPALSNKCRKPFDGVTKKLRRQLGPLRDLDVMLDRLAEMEKSEKHAGAVTWMIQRLEQRRRDAAEDALEQIPPARILSRLGTWWGLRQEIEDAKSEATPRLTQSVHLQLDAFAEQADRLVIAIARRQGGADAPIADAPVTDARTADAPASDPPASDLPATNAPVTYASATESKISDAPATDVTPADTHPAVPSSSEAMSLISPMSAAPIADRSNDGDAGVDASVDVAPTVPEAGVDAVSSDAQSSVSESPTGDSLGHADAAKEVDAASPTNATPAKESTLKPAPAEHNDPHEVRIAGKSLRYTLEMAGRHGMPLPPGVLALFKRLQESLGAWHDLVVLTEHILRESVDSDLALHDPALQGEILGLAQITLRRAQVELKKVADLWKSRGEELSRKIRAAFPLTEVATQQATVPPATVPRANVPQVSAMENPDVKDAGKSASEPSPEAPSRTAAPHVRATGDAASAA